jgi:transcriptional regulator with XRE-family HTH domain
MQLRAAREHLGLSAADVADAVNRWIAEQQGLETTITDQTMYRWESGQVRRPQPHYRAALCAVLGAANPAELGFARATTDRNGDTDTPDNGTGVSATEGDEIVDRRGFLLGALVVPPSLLAGARTPIPATVGMPDAEQVLALAVGFSRAEHAAGAGGLARHAVLAQLEHSTAMLDATMAPDVRPALQSAVAYMAEVAGFGAVDLGAYNEGVQLQRFAEALAEEAGDWSMRATAIAGRIRAAIWAGLPNEAWALAESALIRADLLGPADQAMLHGLKARAVSMLDGRTQETLREVDLADQYFAQIDPATPLPVWLHYYTAAEHNAALADALSGIVTTYPKAAELASARYAASTEQFGAGFRRSAAMSALGDVRLHLVSGDQDRAAEAAGDALGRAAAIRSRRTDTMVREVHQLAADAGMSDLRDQAAEVLPPT